MRLTNLTSRSQVLGDGTILAAAGTPGASKEVAELSERDRRRLVNRGAVHVAEEQKSEGGETKMTPPPAAAGAVAERADEDVRAPRANAPRTKENK